MTDSHVCTIDCYQPVEDPCARCGGQVEYMRSACHPSPPPECLKCEMRCHDCPAEVKITFGVSVYARVIHTAGCPWFPRYRAGALSYLNSDYMGAIPCGVRQVTHRGPYKQRKAAA